MIQASTLRGKSRTNPKRVLQAIGAQSVKECLSELVENSPVEEFVFPRIASDESQSTDQVVVESLESFYPTEQADEFLDDQHSINQIQELAAKLEVTEAELDLREQELNERVILWNESVKQQQKEIETRIQHLEQQSSQVRCQQLHLMQLQTDIVKSYENTKQAIETLVTESGSDAKTVATLRQLKFEITGRFDYISRRWQHLHTLMQKMRDDDIAERSVDDSVDWLA